MALLQPDRTFRLVVPCRDLHVLLFDVLTGLPLEWQSLRPGRAATSDVTLAGNAVEVVMRPTARDPAGADVVFCSIGYVPEASDWPYGIGDYPANEGSQPRERWGGARCAVGGSVTLWVRSRSGILDFSTSMVVEQSLDLSTAAPGPITVELRR